MKEKLERIAQLTDDQIGGNETEVIDRVIKPFLSAFGYGIHDYNSEHTSEGKRLDIYIDDVLPDDFNIALELKGPYENLEKHFKQIEDYAKTRNVLVAILSNGKEFIIFSPTWRNKHEFSDKIIYRFKREDLANENLINRLNSIIGKNSMLEEKADDNVLQREKELKNKAKEIEEINKNLKEEIDKLEKDAQIEIKKVEESSFLIKNILRDSKSANLEQVTKDTNQKPLTEEDFSNTRLKSESPSAREWISLIPELQNKGLSTWKSIASYLKIDVGSDSATRKVRSWCESNKKDWPIVPK